MKAKAVSWVGVKTDSFPEMKHLFADVIGLLVVFEQDDFVVFVYPNGDKLEIFGPNADKPPEQFASGNVMPGILVDDIQDAISELEAAGVELIGTLKRGEDGYAWQHFRAPDGKEFELNYDPERS